MFSRLIALFEPDPPTVVDTLTAAAALLVEAAAMDGRVDGVELDRIRAHLTGSFGLAPAEAEQVLDRARAANQKSVQLAGFARAVRDGMDDQGRIDLIEMVWDVALADGRIDEFEANLVRRVAGLIHVSDRDAGAARHRALARRAGPDRA